MAFTWIVVASIAQCCSLPGPDRNARQANLRGIPGGGGATRSGSGAREWQRRTEIGSLRAGEQRERVRQVSDDLLKRLRAEVPWLLLSLVPEVPRRVLPEHAANQGRLTRWWYETRQRLGYQDMRCDGSTGFQARCESPRDDPQPPAARLRQHRVPCRWCEFSRVPLLARQGRPSQALLSLTSAKSSCGLVVTGGFATELAACPGSCILELQLVGPGPETAVRQMQPARPYTAYVVPTMIPFAHVGKIPSCGGFCRARRSRECGTLGADRPRASLRLTQRIRPHRGEGNQGGRDCVGRRVARRAAASTEPVDGQLGRADV